MWNERAKKNLHFLVPPPPTEQQGPPPSVYPSPTEKILATPLYFTPSYDIDLIFLNLTRLG